LAEDDGPQRIDYTELMRAAVLGVVRQVLSRAAAEGLPGEHHLYLTFGTAEEGVVVSPRLRQQFPEEMTIVLQHQYWGLQVDEQGFAVTLRFGGAPERLVVPWPALRTFVDPSVGFGLQLRPEAPTETLAGSAAGPARNAAEEDASVAEAKVVDFHSYRRRAEPAAGDPETSA
jgi:hypothetical protein